MALSFKKATREQAKARVALIGPSGSGKTYSALLIAHALGQRVAVIDTERGSASKYASITDPSTGVCFEFDVLELESFSPEQYVAAIGAAAQAGFDVLVIDSLSHAWSGKDGALEQVDKAAKKSSSGNSYVAWRDVTPKHNRLVDALTSVPMHLVVTMRSKMEYALVEEERNGRVTKAPKKIGLAPIQREGLEYEFDVVGDIDLEHNWVVSKTRCPKFDGVVINRPGTEFANAYLGWLQEGTVPAEKPAPNPEPEPQRRAPSTPPPRPQPARAANGNSEPSLAPLLTESLIAELNKREHPDDLRDWATGVMKLPKESRAPLWSAFGDRCKQLGLDPGTTARSGASV